MNLLSHLSLWEQGLLVLAALVLLISFILLSQPRLTSMVQAFAWQGALLASMTVLVACINAEWHMLFSAFLTLSLKALLIPWMLHRLIRRQSLERCMDTLPHPALAVMMGALLVIFSYWVVLPIAKLELANTRNLIAISLAVVQIGMLMMVVRHQVVAQVVGFMSIENGLFMAAIAATHGMPLVVELGVAFDVLVAAVIFGVFFFHIRKSIDNFDVDNLNHLSERDDT